MKTTQHEFSLDLYKKAIANPDKYEFVYRNGEKPLRVVYMDGLSTIHPIISWTESRVYYRAEDGKFSKGITSEYDLFILEKHSLTYREALESLPDGYRELALENAEKQNWNGVNPNNECVKISMGLSGSIYWSESPQKYEFWNAVYEYLFYDSPLPPLPVKEENRDAQETVAEEIKPITEEFLSNFNAKQSDQERLDKFVCAALADFVKESYTLDGDIIKHHIGKDKEDFKIEFYYAYAAKQAIALAKETLKQLEGGEG